MLNKNIDTDSYDYYNCNIIIIKRVCFYEKELEKGVMPIDVYRYVV
jgi:hypothetical protein